MLYCDSLDILILFSHPRELYESSVIYCRFPLLHTHIWTHTYTHLHTHTYTHLHTHTPTPAHTHLHTCTPAHTCTHMHAPTHTHTHTHLHTLSLSLSLSLSLCLSPSRSVSWTFDTPSFLFWYAEKSLIISNSNVSKHAEL